MWHAFLLSLKSFLDIASNRQLEHAAQLNLDPLDIENRVFATYGKQPKLFFASQNDVLAGKLSQNDMCLDTNI